MLLSARKLIGEFVHLGAKAKLFSNVSNSVLAIKGGNLFLPQAEFKVFADGQMREKRIRLKT